MLINGRHFQQGQNQLGMFIPKQFRHWLNCFGITHLGASKHIDELHTKDFDLVVTVCDSAAEECPVWPGKAGKRIHHSFVDPAKTEGNVEEQMAVFRLVRGEMLEVIPKILGE